MNDAAQPLAGLGMITSTISSFGLRSIVKELEDTRRSCLPLKVTPGRARPGRSAVPPLRFTFDFEPERNTTSASITAKTVSRSACEAAPAASVPPRVALLRIKRENDDANDARASIPL